MRFVLYTALVLVFAGCAAGGLTGSTGEPTITGLDDALEPTATVHTLNFKKPLILARGQADPAMRAIITKDVSDASLLDSLAQTDNGVAYQFYIQTNSSDWMRWNSIRYLGDAGQLVTLEADVIGTDVDCSRYGCSHYETMVASMSREQLDALAQMGEPSIRLNSGSSSANMDIDLDPLEVSAFVGAVDSALGSLGR